MHRTAQCRDLVWCRNLFNVWSWSGNLFREDAETVAGLLSILLRIDRPDGDRALFHTFNCLRNCRDNSPVGGAVLLRPGSAEALAEPPGGFIGLESDRRLLVAAKTERLE